MLFDSVEFGPYDKAENKANKAFELYEDGKMSQALEELENALQINPYNSAWHFDKALMLDAMNRFDEAINEYDTALQMNPDDLEMLNALAVDYTRDGQYDRAIETFEYIQQIEPTFEPCYCNRIITYTEIGKHDLAEQMFYLAQQINPDCALCYYNIGNSLFARGLYKKAVRCWLRTADLEPSHPQINYRIAQAYWAVGDIEHAREYFLAELRNNAGDIDVIFDYGLLLLEIGEIESAKEKFNRILELQSDFAPALFYLGEIAFNSDDYEQAIELFHQSLKNDCNLRGPYYRLAQFELMAGKKTKAMSYLLSELELEPVDADVLVSMASMFLAIAEQQRLNSREKFKRNKSQTLHTEFENSDLDYATHCLLRAVDIDTANANAHYYLGLVSTLKERYEDAAEFFSHTLDIDNKHIAALRDSAVVYLIIGRLDDATGRINRAQRLASNDRLIKIVDHRIKNTQAKEKILNILRRLKIGFNFKRWLS